MTEDRIPDIFDRIERYCTNDMTQEERRMFESELSKSENLRAEFAIQRELILSIQLGGLRETLGKIAAKTEVSTEVEAHRSQRFAWAWAASIAVIIGLSAWFVLKPSQNDNLFAEYAVAEPGLPVPMSATDNYAFYDAMVDYKAGNFAKARGKFESLLSLNATSDTLNYFIATTLFAEGAYTEALAMYQQSALTMSDNWSAKVQWYATLCQLKLNNEEAVLQVSPIEGSPYAASINAIQQELAN